MLSLRRSLPVHTPAVSRRQESLAVRRSSVYPSQSLRVPCRHCGPHPTSLLSIPVPKSPTCPRVPVTGKGLLPTSSKYPRSPGRSPSVPPRSLAELPVEREGSSTSLSTLGRRPEGVGTTCWTRLIDDRDSRRNLVLRRAPRRASWDIDRGPVPTHGPPPSLFPVVGLPGDIDRRPVPTHVPTSSLFPVAGLPGTRKTDSGSRVTPRRAGL